MTADFPAVLSLALLLFSPYFLFILAGTRSARALGILGLLGLPLAGAAGVATPECFTARILLSLPLVIWLVSFARDLSARGVPDSACVPHRIVFNRHRDTDGILEHPSPDSVVTLTG